MSFPKPIKVKSNGQYRIFISYSDGTEGILDLDYLKEKPIFHKWASPDFFNSVYINQPENAISWDEDIELCPDNLYLKLKKMSFSEYNKQLTKQEYASDK